MNRLSPYLQFLFCFLLAFPLSQNSCQAQKWMLLPGQAPYQKFDIQKQIPAHTTRSMAIDSLGYLWLGTKTGLVRYDGYEAKTYMIDKSGAYSNIIYRIFVDSHNRIWLSTGTSGSYIFNPTTEKFLELSIFEKNAEGLYEEGIRDFGEDKQGNIWAIGKNTVIKFFFEAGEKLPTHLVFPTQRMEQNHALIDEKDNLWITSSQGLHQLILKEGEIKDSTDYSFRNIAPTGVEQDTFFSFKPEFIFRLDQAHFLLSGMAYPIQGIPYPLGIYNIQERTFTPISHDIDLAIFLPPENHPYQVSKIWQARSGQFWISTSAHGLHKFSLPQQWQDSTKIQLQTHPYYFYWDEDGAERKEPAVAHQPQFDMVSDRYGNLWVGGQFTLMKIDISSPYLEKIHFPVDFIDGNGKKRGAWVDRNENIWNYETPNKLYYYDTTRSSLVRYLDKEASPFPLGSDFGDFYLQDQEGNFWAGSGGPGRNEGGRYLYKLDREEMKMDSFLVQTPFRVAPFWEDPTGEIWAADFKGNVFKGDGSTNGFLPYSIYSDSTKLNKQSEIFGRKLDEEGNIWMAFVRGGIGKLSRSVNEEGKDQILFEEFLPEYECYSLYMDSDNRLLIGSAYEILVFDREERKIIQKYSLKDGLRGNTFLFLVKDRHGRIWFNNQQNVGIFDPAKQYTYYPRAIENDLFIIPIQHYQNDNFTVIRQIKNPQGLVKIYHHQYVIDSIPPDMIIEGVFSTSEHSDTLLNLLSNTYSVEGLKLSWKQNNLEITFNGLHYDDPTRNFFQYRLVGANSNWVDAGQERIARYVDLSPNTYTFEVKATNADGVWSMPKQLTITIFPPWWYTWWAYAIYGCLLIGIIYSAYRFQLRRQLALAEAQKYREIDRVKSRLYTNITHEFRTPLTIIQGMVEQIQDHSQIKQMVLRNTQQLLTLVSQLLDLTKLEVGKLDLQEVQADVIPFIHYVVESLQSLAQIKGIELRVHSELDTLTMDHDRDKLKDVLTNLISNAIKFTPSGGEVAVHIFEPQKAFLAIEVRDTGVGIPPQQLPYVFDRFFQADTGHTRKWEGTGIGLALVKELVTLMNGNVEVKSEKDNGSTFRVLLPIKHGKTLFMEDPFYQEDLSADFPLIQENVFLNKSMDAPRALIVEDNDDVIYYLKSLLGEKYQLFVAQNGREGMDLARELTPDIILSDVMMPEVDGYELCSTLKHDILTSHIPIILLTAKGDFESKLSGLSEGADAYLPKPFNPRELTIRIEQLIASREKLRAYFSTGEPISKELQKDPLLELENSFLQSMREVVYQRMDDAELTIPKVAEAVHVERSQLYRKVHALTGMSPSLYIRKIRLNHARELLRSSGMNVSEVAVASGFNNNAYFSRKYKEEFGVSPNSDRIRS